MLGRSEGELVSQREWGAERGAGVRELGEWYFRGIFFSCGERDS